MRNTTGNALVWILIGILTFGLILVSVVQASSSSRRALVSRQRSLERMLEAHRLARWACAQSEDDLVALPARLGASLPDIWEQKLQAQAAAGDAEPDALRGLKVELAVEANAGGRRHLHRVLVRVLAPDKSVCVVARTVLR